MASFRRVCRSDELAPGGARLVTLDGKEIALFNVDGTLHATEDVCLHAGGPLHEGRLEGSVVTCPWHEWKFDVTTGACHLNPMVKLACYRVRVREGFVEIEV